MAKAKKKRKKTRIEMVADNVHARRKAKKRREKEEKRRKRIQEQVQFRLRHAERLSRILDLSTELTNIDSVGRMNLIITALQEAQACMGEGFPSSAMRLLLSAQQSLAFITFELFRQSAPRPSAAEVRKANLQAKTEKHEQPEEADGSKEAKADATGKSSPSREEKP